MRFFFFIFCFFLIFFDDLFNVPPPITGSDCIVNGSIGVADLDKSDIIFFCNAIPDNIPVISVLHSSSVLNRPSEIRMTLLNISRFES